MMDYMHKVGRSQVPTNQSARKHSKLARCNLEHSSHFSSRSVCNDAESAIEKTVSSWNCHEMILWFVFNSWYWRSLQSGHQCCFVGGRNQVLTWSRSARQILETYSAWLCFAAPEISSEQCHLCHGHAHSFHTLSSLYALITYHRRLQYINYLQCR